MGLSSTLPPEPVLPPPLGSGARIGVAALSGVASPQALESGIAALEAEGFEVVEAANLGREHGLFAGSDGERLDGLHALARDASIEAILFARGGHGVLRLLPDIDWDLLALKPRWFVGFSDLTPLLAQIPLRLGWVALHGPMVAAEPALGAEELASLRQALEGRFPLEISLAGTHGGWAGVEGRMTGGCLSMLASTLGTPWAVPTADAVLFLEDVHEPLYRVDRMMQQLRMAGALDGVRGVVLGPFETEDGSPHPIESLLEMVGDALPTRVPIAWGCPSGHCRPNLTLAIGAWARVDPKSLRLTVAGKAGPVR